MTNFSDDEYDDGLGELTANTTYHYRIIAKDEKGTVVATTEDRTFNTPPR